MKSCAPFLGISLRAADTLPRYNPFGIGGSLELCFPVDCQYPVTLMDGYFYVTSMTDLAQVPAPIVGADPFGLLVGALLIVGLARKYRVRLV
jgi:hypothetical protein